MDVKTDIVIRAEHTGADSGSSGKTKHDGRKKTTRLMMAVRHRKA